ncbi:MAG: nuclear transport factor 2 family protein [Terriglobales bacterium]
MRKMRIAALAFVFSGVLLLCRFQANAQQTTAATAKNGPAQKGNSVQNQVIEKEMLAWELSKKKDRSKLADLLSADFIEITDDGIKDRAQILANLENLTLIDYSATDFRAKHIAPNIVLLIYKVTVTGKYKESGFKNNDYAASMWMKRAGKWQNVFFQETVLSSSNP